MPLWSRFFGGKQAKEPASAPSEEHKGFRITPQPIREGGHYRIAARIEKEVDGEIFYSLREAEIVIESWRRHYNTKRPHSSLGYRPPAPEVVQWPASPTGAASLATPAVATKPVMQ